MIVILKRQSSLLQTFPRWLSKEETQGGTAQKLKFFIHLLNKSLMENFIICAVWDASERAVTAESRLKKVTEHEDALDIIDSFLHLKQYYLKFNPKWFVEISCYKNVYKSFSHRSWIFRLD